MRFASILVSLLLAITAAAQETRPVMVAKHTAQAVVIDGKLDEAVWKTAPAYAFHLADDRDPEKKDAVQEGARAQLAWDDKNFYVAVRFTDTDAVAKGTKKNEFHFKLGDVAEVFLKPLSNTVYWELYVTPHSMTSTYCFESYEKRGEESAFEYDMEIDVAGRVEGTLNESGDKDQCWTGEMAVPISELEKFGDKFPGEGWTILVARYNYSRALNRKAPELTMTPRLTKTSYHHHPGYARLRLEE